MRGVPTLLVGALWVVGAQVVFWAGWVGDDWLPAIALVGAIAVWILFDRYGALGTQSRFAALTAAVVAVPIGNAALALSVLTTVLLRAPDPDPSLDGDPCCGHPDTWTDVIVGGGFFTVEAFVALTVLGGSGVMATAAILGRFPAALRGRGRVVRRIAAAAALGVVAVPATLALQSLLVA
jgi:hypothetical protein